MQLLRAPDGEVVRFGSRKYQNVLRVDTQTNTVSMPFPLCSLPIHLLCLLSRSLSFLGEAKGSTVLLHESVNQAPQWGKSAKVNQRAERAERRLGKRTGRFLPSPPPSFPTPPRLFARSRPLFSSFFPFFAPSPTREPVHRLSSTCLNPGVCFLRFPITYRVRRLFYVHSILQETRFLLFLC